MNGALVGYARVSTVGQSLEIQEDALSSVGCSKVFKEKKSGVDRGRPELERCLEFLREGDTLIVTKLDRLARSAVHLHTILDELTSKAVGFKVLDQSGIDTTTPTGKLVVGVLASVAEFELNLRAERQREGIAKAKEKGVYKGRPTKVSDEQKAEIVKRYASGEGESVALLTKEYELSRAHVYRIINAKVA